MGVGLHLAVGVQVELLHDLHGRRPPAALREDRLPPVHRHGATAHWPHIPKWQDGASGAPHWRHLAIARPIWEYVASDLCPAYPLDYLNLLEEKKK